MKRVFFALGGLSILAALLTIWPGVGRRFWYPTYLKLSGRRSHESVLASIGPVRRPALQEAAAAVGLAYPPQALALVGLKAEHRLEAWAQSPNGWRIVKAYPVLAASGGPGPKLREGDQQVPEGIYRISEFNPNSSYHLSLRVDYPNAEDRAIAEGEGRRSLGGDIFIHGKAVSIGCLALGDAAIEELYVLVADVGLQNTRVLLSPSATPTSVTTQAGWVRDLYGRLGHELLAVRGSTS